MNERFESMTRKAREMALSGDYVDSLAIELELRRKGYREARVWMRDLTIRLEFDRLCWISREEGGIRSAA
ncbi:MAG: hypothetical protein HKL98_06395 [Burkholderiales bacterium]|nr:hypothetical protein [Burkholderiales bacterium]